MFSIEKPYYFEFIQRIKLVLFEWIAWIVGGKSLQAVWSDGLYQMIYWNNILYSGILKELTTVNLNIDVINWDILVVLFGHNDWECYWYTEGIHKYWLKTIIEILISNLMIMDGLKRLLYWYGRHVDVTAWDIHAGLNILNFIERLDILMFRSNTIQQKQSDYN